MAEKSHTPTRRAALACLAATPVAGLPALAGAVAGQSPVALAIARHMTAKAAIEEYPGDDDLPEHLVDAESGALIELAQTPCADDAEFFTKLNYMIRDHKRAFGPFWASTGAEEILTAAELHLRGGA
ncbi:MAG: hypothetical protein EKK29_10560 [Hyphomicrobiales bacterium]|nr:MAG: hypothetical protein EKK29_10560 [Hyphomicrobiales bacterium]